MKDRTEIIYFKISPTINRWPNHKPSINFILTKDFLSKQLESL